MSYAKKQKHLSEFRQLNNNLYDIVAVPRDTKDMQKIKIGGKKQLSKFHTDRPENLTRLQEKYPNLSLAEIKNKANDLTKKVNYARSILGDIYTKELYDNFVLSQQKQDYSQKKEPEPDTNAEDCKTTDDFTLYGTKNIKGNFIVNGDLQGNGTLNVSDNTAISGDMQGNINLHTHKLYIKQDLYGAGKINAKIVIIQGDISGAIEINAESIKIYGDIDGNPTLNARLIIVDGDISGAARINAETTEFNGDISSSISVNGMKYSKTHNTHDHYSSRNTNHDKSDFNNSWNTANDNPKRRSMSMVNINGVSIESNGYIYVSEGIINANNTTKIKIKYGNNEIEITGCEITNNRTVWAGEIKLNGHILQTGGCSIDILDICPEIKSQLTGNHQSHYKSNRSNPFSI